MGTSVNCGRVLATVNESEVDGLWKLIFKARSKAAKAIYKHSTNGINHSR